MSSISGDVEDLGRDLCGGVDSTMENNHVSKLESSSDGQQRNIHNVAVNNLYHHERAIVSHDVECLGLDIGILVGAPPQVVFGQDSVGRLLRLLRNGSDGFGAIDGFLRSSNACETTCG